MGPRVLASLAFVLAVAAGVPAAADEQTILHLLDYVAVDYPEAVADGKVKNEDEYKEMLEFTAQAAAQFNELTPNPRKDALVAAAESLAALVTAKAGAAAVADAAGKLRWALIEMFETVLFYQALWVQAGEAGRGAFLGGVGAAVAALAAIGWAIFRYGVRLPLGPFFAVTSILLCGLAIVLVGKGVAALQEAGAIPVDLVDAIPAVTWLGVFPTWQTLGAQAAVLAVVIAAFLAAGRAARRL